MTQQELIVAKMALLRDRAALDLKRAQVHRDRCIAAGGSVSEEEAEDAALDVQEREIDLKLAENALEVAKCGCPAKE